MKTKYVQLNLHETDLLFWYLSHHLTWHCSSISEDVYRFARHLLHMNIKLFLLLFLNNFKCATPRNNNKNNFAFIFCKFLANLFKFSEILEQHYVKWWLNYRKYWCHIYLAVPFRSNFLFQILSKITGAYNLSLNQSKPETRIPSRYVINNHVFLTS